MDVLLREAVPDDAYPAAQLLIEVFPHLPVTEHQVRWHLTDPAADEAARHVAAVDGQRLVGWARSTLDPEEAGHGRVLIAVMPGWRLGGLGSALLADAELHLAAAGATTLHSRALDDETIRTFCATRGWHPSGWARYLSLDLASIPAGAAPVPPDGVTLLPAWTLDHLYPLYQVHAECVEDEPRDVPPTSLSYERWQEEVWRAPGHDPASGVIAMLGDRLVSFSLADVDRSSGRMWSTMTGTVRGWRGRGLATLVKATALHRAAERGLRIAWTVGSDSAPMTAVNTRLGYRPTLTQVILVRHLTEQ